MKTICIARLRSNVNYIQPLDHILDFWYLLLERYVKQNSGKYNFVYYNFGFNQKPTRDLEAIRKADVIIIPSEAEFQYHIPGYIHTLDCKTSNNHVKEVFDLIQGTNKKLLILQSDRKDSPDLYRTRTFPGLTIPVEVVDDMDFKGTIQAVRYWIIREYIENSPLLSDDEEKLYDFCYYGCDKSKDVGGVKSLDLRGEIMKKAHKDPDITSYFIGRFKGFVPNLKWQKNMRIIIPYMQQSRTTLCFNWPGFEKDPTTRYAEALACNMIPLVWHNYDITNRVVCDDWQRCADYKSFKQKINELRKPKFFKEKYDQILENYLENKILTVEEYYEDMVQRFEKVIDKD
jgi:hypothetical protein